MTEIAGEKSSTIVFPLPVNVFESFQQLIGDGTGGDGAGEPNA